jgi:hypothetical protein
MQLLPALCSACLLLPAVLAPFTDTAALKLSKATNFSAILAHSLQTLQSSAILDTLTVSWHESSISIHQALLWTGSNASVTASARQAFPCNKGLKFVLPCHGMVMC